MTIFAAGLLVYFALCEYGLYISPTGRQTILTLIAYLFNNAGHGCHVWQGFATLSRVCLPHTDVP